MTDSWYSISFGRTYQTPRFLAALATYSDTDNCELRYQNLSTTGVQVRVEEDTTYDSETQHLQAEAVHYLVFAGSGGLRARVWGSGDEVRKYYALGSQRVAMRVSGAPASTPTRNGVYYLYTDHLGSTSLVTTGENRGVMGGILPAGSVWLRQLYDPYGAVRYASTPHGPAPTDYGYTGQRATQGNRILIATRQDREQILFIPPSFQSFRLDTAFGSFLLLQQIECNVAYDHQVLCRMAFAHSALIFSKGDVEGPMNAVLDTPVATHCLAEFFRAANQAGDVIASLICCLAVYLSRTLNHSDAPEVCPGPLRIRVRDEFGFRDQPIPPGFDAPVTFLDGLVTIMRHILEVDLLRVRDEALHILQQGALITLECQYVVASLVNNSLDNLGLAAHRINGDDAPLDYQHLQQFRDGRDLVRFLVYL